VWDEEKNKALVHWWWEEVWLKGNVAAMDEFMATNYGNHPIYLVGISVKKG
jgi:hypothetical protein